MKKKTFVICDRDADYVDRFSRYLEQREEHPFAVYSFTEPELLADYLSEARPDILLLDEELASEELWQLAGERCRVRLQLTETPGTGETPMVVYRYQSAERILRQAMAGYERTMAPSEQAEALRAEIYGVYSPVKRCYKTTFSLILGQLLAEHRPTLYLNFEDCAGLAALCRENSAENLSDVLYYYRVEQPGHLKLYSVVQSMGKLSYIPPVVCPGDIREAAPQELVKVVTAIGARDEYSFLVLDLGDALRDPLPLLQLCKRIYMPLREDAVSRARVAAFADQIKGSGNGELLRRIRRLVLPEVPGMEDEAMDGAGICNSRFGRYVERILQEDGL